MLKLIRHCTTFLLFVSVAISCVDGAHASESVRITFTEAWQMVNDNNDSLKAARAKVAEAEFSHKASQDLSLPEISLGANYLYLDDDVQLSPNDLFESMEAGAQASQIAAGFAQSYGLTPAQLNAGLTSTITEREVISSSIRGTWPIYTGGRISAAQDIASKQVNEARYDLNQTGIEQFQQLVGYYFGAVLAQQVLNTRIEVEDGLRTHRDHAVLLEKQGQIARVERMQSEASLDKATVERKKAQRNLEISELALTRMLKSQQSVVPADDLFLADKLPPVDSFIEKTLSNYPGLGILESKKEQAEGLASAEKGKYFPTVALVGNYNLYEEDNLATTLTPDWFVGVGVSIPILERSGRSGKLQAARTVMKQLDHLTQQAQSDLTVLVEKTYRQALQALEEFEGLQSSRQLAEETVDLRIKAFNQGLGTSLDVVDAELFLAGVKNQRAIAVYNYVIALGKLIAVSSPPNTFFTYQNNKGIEDR